MRKLGPVFLRVLKCFESQSELARQVGVERRMVFYWQEIGYIPPDYALAVSLACQGRVSTVELLTEAVKGAAARKARKENGLGKMPQADVPEPRVE